MLLNNLFIYNIYKDFLISECSPRRSPRILTEMMIQLDSFCSSNFCHQAWFSRESIPNQDLWPFSRETWLWGGESSRISIVLNGAIVSTVQNFFRLPTFRFLLVSCVSLAGLVLEVSASFLGMGHIHVSATNQLESTTHHCFWVNNSLNDTLKKRCATLLGGPFRCCYLWTCWMCLLHVVVLQIPELSFGTGQS